MDLGSTKRTSVILGDNLSDNKWHEIKVHRNQKTVDLAIDKLKRRTTVQGDNVRLDLDTTLYVGGLASVVQRLDSAIHRINPYPVDSAISFPNTYPLDSDLSGG